MRASLLLVNCNRIVWYPRSLLQAGNWDSRSVEEEEE